MPCTVNDRSIYCDEPASQIWVLRTAGGKEIRLSYDNNLLWPYEFWNESAPDPLTHQVKGSHPVVTVHFRVFCTYERVSNNIIFIIGMPVYKNDKFAGEVRYADVFGEAASVGFSCPLKPKHKRETRPEVR